METNNTNTVHEIETREVTEITPDNWLTLLFLVGGSVVMGETGFYVVVGGAYMDSVNLAKAASEEAVAVAVAVKAAKRCKRCEGTGTYAWVTTSGRSMRGPCFRCAGSGAAEYTLRRWFA